jgi:hypothetical protein
LTNEHSNTWCLSQAAASSPTCFDGWESMVQPLDLPPFYCMVFSIRHKRHLVTVTQLHPSLHLFSCQVVRKGEAKGSTSSDQSNSCVADRTPRYAYQVDRRNLTVPSPRSSYQYLIPAVCFYIVRSSFVILKHVLVNVVDNVSATSSHGRYRLKLLPQSQCHI